MNEDHSNESPFTSDFSSALRKSWALRIKLNHPAQRLKGIAPYHVRLKAAVQVITQGPMLAGPICCSTVMWDADSFNGHAVAAEAASLLTDFIMMAYTHLQNDEKERLDIYSVCRKREFEERNGTPLVVIASDFLNAYPDGELLNHSASVIYEHPSDAVRFYLCTTTKALVGIAVPYSCTMAEFVAEAKLRLSTEHQTHLEKDYLQISEYLYRKAGDAA